jgi:aspartate racemase
MEGNMKTIGLLGGMSWESTVLYYQEINAYVKEALGGLHSAKCILYSIDFHEIADCQSKGDWDKASDILSSVAADLEQIGADFIVICTNTMHKIANNIQKRIRIPILHIAEVTANQLIKNGIRNVGLLGTKYTMEQEFYKEVLISKGVNVIVPDKEGIEFVNNAIYNELCLGIFTNESKQQFLAIMDDLSSQGVQGIILGCTEIGLLIKQEDTPMPLFDTALIHAREAAKYAIKA